MNRHKTPFLFILTIYLSISCNDSKKPNNISAQTDSTKIESKVFVTEPQAEIKGNIQGDFGGCGYNQTPTEKSINLYEPRPRELSQINSILKFSGLASNFKIYSASISNAVATIINEKRYILYDPKLLSFTDMKSGSYWSSMSILAHEIGHHLSGHTITNKGSNPKDELEADKYSGFVMYKLGATLAEATDAIKTLGSEMGSSTHPPKDLRIKAISQGWNQANETRSNGAIPPPLNDETNLQGIEFKLQDFNDEEQLREYYSNYSYSQYGFFEGIITDVQGPDENLNYELGIYVTNKPKRVEYKIDINELKRRVLWSYPKNASNSYLGEVKYILKPGRKIRFGIEVTGSGGYVSITYLKVLTRQ